MQDIIAAVDQWREQGKGIALATVVETWGSAPRGVGAKMVVNSDGDMAGSVSGGCVESAVVEAGIQTIKTGTPRKLSFGVSDDEAIEVGLACGGKIEVFLQALNRRVFDILQRKWEAGETVVRFVVLEGREMGEEWIVTGDGEVVGCAHSHAEAIRQLARDVQMMCQPYRTKVKLSPSGAVDVLLDLISPPPTLVIVGGVHIAIPLVVMAKALGYRTVVIDPRRKFGQSERFPHADEIINAWPGEAFSKIAITETTAIVMLTHDPKIDDPALELALTSEAFYVGALGSRKTQAQRRERLLAKGLQPAQVNRVRGPIGLDLGGRAPEEIALAVMAEIVKTRNDRKRTTRPEGTTG